MPQIVVAGAPTGCWTNLGDEAILAGMAASLRAAVPGVELTIVSSSPDGFFDAYDCAAVRYDDLDGVDRAVAASDLVVLGGGSIFFDYWGCDPAATLTAGHQGLSLWTGLALTAAAHDRPLMVYAAGVGPLRTDDGRLLARAAFELADEITLRDHDAAAALAELGLTLDHHVTGDPALEVPLPAPPDLDLPRPWLGVALRPWDVGVDPERWPVDVARALDRHLDVHGGTVLFIPCHRPVSWPLTDDAGVAATVASHMAGARHAHAISVDQPWQERAALFGACDAVLAMRYHAALFAMAAGVPTVALSYDPKVAGFLADWGAADQTIDLTDLTADAIGDRLARAVANRDEQRLHLHATAASRRAEAGRTAERAAALIGGGRRAPRTGPASQALVELLDAEPRQRPARATAVIDRVRSASSDVGVDHGTGPRPTVAILTNQLLDRATGEPRIGGAERYALELARLFHDLGMAPTFYQLGGSGWTTGDYFGFPVHALPEGEVYSEFQLGVGQAFHDRTLDDDHVLYLMPNYASGPMRDDAVVVSHGVWWDHNLWGHLSFRTPEWYEHLERVFARAARVVSVDVNTINVVRALFPDAASRLRHVPSAVDTAQFRPPDERENDIPLVLFPRRADIIRGPQLVGPLLDRVPDPCRAVWLGGGDPGLLDQLREVADRDPRLSIDDASFDAMPDRYREADICVIPTVGSEGQSLACLEAMASGCAVVATRVGGLPELIRDGVDGLLCDPTPDSLADAVRRLVRDPALRLRLGAEARRTAEQRSLLQWRADWAAELVDLGWVSDPTPAVPYDIVCFSVIDWDFRWQRPQQMMTHWARRGRRVFYLRITDLLDPDGAEKVVVDELADGVWEVRVPVPAGFDLHGASHPDDLAAVAQPGLDALRRRFGIGSAVGLVEHAGWTPLALAARESFGWPVVYDCMDDWHTFPGFADSPTFLAAEERLVAEADAMSVSSQTIADRWVARRPDLVLARNAVDFDFYRQRSPEEQPVLAEVDGPIAGFVGAVAEWFDRELVEAVARARPDVTFVFVGGVHRVSVDELASLPNVLFLGQRPYDEMPSFIARFDACLVPFEVSPVTDGMDVVKLYEYLSQGKPVVSTPIREMLIYRDLVHLAHDAHEFARQLDRALAEDDPALTARRIELARQNTWHDRIDRVDELVIPLLGERATPAASRAATDVPLGGPTPGSSRYWQEQADRLHRQLDEVHRSRAWRAANVYWRGLNRAKRLMRRVQRPPDSSGAA